MQDRQKLILKAIIQEFIETAKPIGSKTILLGYNFDVSPATIRSDMATLEKEGLIMQPHTSAGRIPTDLGYRIFVDELAEFDTMRAQAKKQVQTLREHFAKNKVKKKELV